MSTDRFNREQFQEALDHALVGTGHAASQVGLVNGEFRFIIQTGDHVFIHINSSIDYSGFASDTGENSIRLWVADETLHPLMGKFQRWITRQPGWDKRLGDALNQVLKIAKRIEVCPKCHQLAKVNEVKKDGPNKGRLFLKCGCSSRFEWLDLERADSTPINLVANPDIPLTPKVDNNPLCPICDGPTIRRHGSKGDFWGCKNYPVCKGSMDVGADRAKVVQMYINMGVRARPAAQRTPAEEDARDAKRQALLQHVNEVTTIEKPKEFKANPQQEAIFKWVTDTTEKALLVEALAGTGKTTTGVRMLQYVPAHLETIYVAFGKEIAAELRKRVPSHVKVKTYHSLGLAICSQAFKGVEVDDDKIYHILETLLDKKTHKHLLSPIRQLVGLVKANLTGTTVEELEFLASHYGIDLNGDAEVVFQTVAHAVARSASMTNVIDYDDMCWLPVVLDLPAHQYDFIFIDEAQDTNKCQIALALMSVKDNGRIVAVGDRHQSLYGFRGADIDAIPNLIEHLGASTLPLSTTYRCPRKVVELVHSRFDYIPLECPEWAEEGIIRTIREDVAEAEYRDGDMVLCRTNAPLVEPAFALIRKGVKAVIRGRDIGKGLIVLVDKMKQENVHDLIITLTEYKAKEVTKLMEAEKGTQAQALADKVDTIIALTDGVDTIEDLTQKIVTIFSDDCQGVVFSSVHRAKGLEAVRVFILHPELFPHPMATQEWEKIQERNIEYVAITRTLHELVYVTPLQPIGGKRNQ